MNSAERKGFRLKGNVPNLRFPEYSDKWLECELQDIAELSKGAGISKDQLSETGESCILYGELYTKYKSEVISNVVSKTDIESTNLVRSKANDVIIPSSGETAIDISTARCVPYDNILLGGDLNIIRLKYQDGRFFCYQLNGVRKLDIAQIAQGVSVVHLYGDSLKRLKVRYPSISEQGKISSLLSVIDERIETQNKIIEDLRSLKAYIHNRVFSKENTLFGQRNTIRLSEIATKITRKNKGNTINNVLSNSAAMGIVPQAKVFDKEIANEDNTANYFVIGNGDFVYNPRKSAQAPFGPINMYKGQEEGIISPLYLCFQVKNINKNYLLHYFISNVWYSYIYSNGDTGVRHDRVSIKDEIFLDMPLYIHTVDKQQEIAKMMDQVDAKIALEEMYLIKLKKQKNYLLAAMFV